MDRAVQWAARSNEIACFDSESGRLLVGRGEGSLSAAPQYAEVSLEAEFLSPGGSVEES